MGPTVATPETKHLTKARGHFLRSVAENKIDRAVEELVPMPGLEAKYQEAATKPGNATMGSSFVMWLEQLIEQAAVRAVRLFEVQEE